MDITYTPKDAVIDTVAIALILLPEPTTTALGIAMMARPRGKNKQAASSGKPLHNYPDYVYKVDVIRGREITWEAKMTMPGQLPLPQQNKPSIKIKQRESLILNRTASSQQTSHEAPIKLPYGVKIHHTIIEPVREIRPTSNGIPGETVHHTIKEFPRPATILNKSSSEGTIHHTIENSPAYIRSQATRTNQGQRDTIIHHSIQNSPAAQINNPIKIEKPMEIRQHHTINTKPSTKQWEPLIPPAPTRAKRNLIEKDSNSRG